MIDETPKLEQRVLQLDLLVKYFSESIQQVVVEHLNSFNLGHATGGIFVECIEDALTELLRQRLRCFFFSNDPNECEVEAETEDEPKTSRCRGMHSAQCPQCIFKGFGLILF